MNTRILLVEDDERLAELPAEYLTKNDLQVSVEPRGDVAETRILAEQPDLVILDVMLPGKDGFEVCRAVRSQYRGVILMLTARDEDFDQFLGLDMGADDYIAKPVQPRVLLARIKALLRRLPSPGEAASGESDSMVFGQFKISQATRTASLAGETIDLTTAEFDLLWLLANHAGNVLSRDDLLQEQRSLGLARSLFRVSLPRWRGSRYSLSKLFFNFYLLAMGSFVAIAFTADFVISTAQRGITDDYARRFMRGTITMIEDELFRQPRRDWQKRIKEIDEKFSYKLGIVERISLDRTLTPTQVVKLDAGDIAIDHDGDIMYHRLGTSSQVLAVGPLASNRNPELKDRLPLELRLRLLTWSLTGLIFGIALWFWVRPGWRDLESLRQTARDLGDGKFETRSPAARSQLFAPLSDTMNSMTERVQHLLATHRELSCGISHELRTPITRMRFALEMLSETDERAERERLWAMMEADLDELDQLIDTSLTYARFEREAPEAHLSTVKFAEWLTDEVDAVRLLGRQLEVTVDTGKLPENLCADLDRKAMPYALRNLLRNAFKYDPKRSSVNAEMAGDNILLHVDDDGIGIPPEEREHVFSAFTRLDRSRDRSTGGYGLGLAIARRVLELHGGTATADSSLLCGARLTLSWKAHQ